MSSEVLNLFHRANRAWLLLQRLRLRKFLLSVVDGRLIVTPGSRLTVADVDEIREHRDDLVGWVDDPIAHAIALDAQAEPPETSCEVREYDIVSMPGIQPVAMRRTP